MKTLILCALASVLCLTTGCQSFRDKTPDQKAAEIQSLAQDAASIGGAAALMAQPQYRPAFEAAYVELDRQVNGTAVISLESIRSVLATLPIKELQGKEAALEVQGARIVIRRVLNSQAEQNLHLYTRAIATGIRDGLKEALGQ